MALKPYARWQNKKYERIFRRLKSMSLILTEKSVKISEENYKNHQKWGFRATTHKHMKIGPKIDVSEYTRKSTLFARVLFL